MFSWIWRTDYQAKVLSDPIEDEEGWSYRIKFISKTWYLFGIKIWREKLC
jgi:hypothetical protein